MEHKFIDVSNHQIKKSNINMWYDFKHMIDHTSNYADNNEIRAKFKGNISPEAINALDDKTKAFMASKAMESNCFSVFAYLAKEVNFPLPQNSDSWFNVQMYLKVGAVRQYQNEVLSECCQEKANYDSNNGWNQSRKREKTVRGHSL